MTEEIRSAALEARSIAKTFRQGPKDVEVLVSSEGTEGEFTSVGRFTVHNWRHIDAASKPLPDQRFAIEPVKARFIKLRLLSNHGGDYIELGEFKAYQGSQ